MCGIVGYVGGKEVVPVLLGGLERLEYRGYDSAGVAIVSDGSLIIRKTKGRLQALCDMLCGCSLSGTVGIGHTRWATHGEPSFENSHPHTNCAGDIAIVHNGIIENYIKLKNWLAEEGAVFVSETDTEVVAHLINYFYKGDLLEAVTLAVARLEGSYALGVVSERHPDTVIATRKDSPLIVGLGQGENFIASDIPALLEYTRDVIFLEDKEIAVLTKDAVDITDEYGKPVNRESYHVSWDAAQAQKGGHAHFMIKEIHEEPRALADTIFPRIINRGINLEECGISEEFFRGMQKVNIIACGTAFHASVLGKYLIEDLARIPVEVEIASEFRYRKPIIISGQLVIIVSQSGETADTLAALREARRHGAKILAIVNVVGSTIAREADAVLYTHAGPEIAVASTKAYSTQLAALYLIALKLAHLTGQLDEQAYAHYVETLQSLPGLIERILQNKQQLARLASRQFSQNSVFFIGRGLDYVLSLEASLKLKEISYIHSEGYAAGELKHGTIALIEPGTLVVALVTQRALLAKTVSNIKEVKARGAHVLAVCFEGSELPEGIADEVIALPDTDDLFAPILAVLPMQLFAYYMAVEKGCDVDKPRNLAKSVTVE